MYINVIKEATMKNHSIRYIEKLLGCLLFTLIFSTNNKLKATEVEEMKNHSISGMKPIKEESSEDIIDIIEDIINGRFRENVDYLSILPSSSGGNEDVDSSMLGYAYQVLGQHYMIEKKDASKAALSYSRSLNYYPFNDELTFYLKKIGVKRFTNEDIEKALGKIIR